MELFEVSDPSEARGNTVTAREVLDRGAQRIREELEEEPEVRSALMDAMGLVYQRLGLYREAAPLLEEALALRRQAHGDVHLEVADSLGDLADLRFAQREGVEDAERLYREALGIYQELLEPTDPAIARTLSNLALLQQARQRYDEAEALHQESLALMRRLYGPEHPRIAATLSNLGALHQQRGNLEAAETYYRESLGMRRKLLAPEHPDIARAALRLARVLAAAGRHASAEPLLGEAIGIFQHSHLAGTWIVPYAQGLQGISLAALGRFEEAEPLLLAGYEDALAANAEAGVRALGERLGTVYTGLGRLEEAARYRTPSSGDAPSGSAPQNPGPEVRAGVTAGITAQRARSRGLPSRPTPAGSGTRRSSGPRLPPGSR